MSEVTVATLLRQQGQSQQAAEGLMRWLSQHPKDDQAWSTLADCMFDLGDSAKAEVALRRAISSNPARTDLALSLAHAMQSQGKHDLSLEVLRNALTADPENLDVSIALGMAMSQLNQPQAALNHFDALSQIHSTHPAVWSFKSLLHTRLRQYTEALMAADQSLKLLHENPQGWFARGRVCKR